MRALTVDLEDWYQVYNLNIDVSSWDRYQSRVVNNTKKILDILDEHDQKATFFVLGWIADKFPYLVAEIQGRGHEIACHGYNHKPIYHMTKEEFAADIDKAKKAIKKACGVDVKGYRAPSFSVVKKTLWAIDVLKEKEFEYDSSIVKTDKHPDYGIADIPSKPFTVKGIKEIPIITKFGLPVGGGYFRLYPYWLTKFLLRLNKDAVLYVHPWEFDAKQPRVKLPVLRRIRQYIGLGKNEKKFRKLLRDFKFCRIEDLAINSP